MTPTRHLQFAFDTHALLSRPLQLGHNANFECVPSHGGLPGNDLADGAAKTAHASASAIAILLAVRDVKSVVGTLGKSIAIQPRGSIRITSTPACVGSTHIWHSSLRQAFAESRNMSYIECASV